MAYQSNPGGVNTTAPVVVGLFSTADDAHAAVTQLRASGFTSQQIGAAFRGNARSLSGGRDVPAVHETSAPHESWWEKVKDAFRPEEDRAASTSAAVSPATDDYGRSEYEYDYAGEDVAGALAAAGIPAQRAAYLTRSLEPGGAIVTVADADRFEAAETILADNNARVRYEDADPTNAAYADDAYADDAYTGVAAGNAATTTADRVAGTGLPGAAAAELDPIASTGYATEESGRGLDRVQLFGEVLRIHKERIQRGEVRVRKDVVTENQSIEVPVTREEFVLERVPVSGTTPASTASIGRDQEIRVPLSEETVRVEKQPVITEEVRVGKRDVSEVATVNDTVRHEELRVDTDADKSADVAGSRAVASEGSAANDLRRRS